MKMARKATHDGTCQVCGRAQALPGGKLAKHGYEVAGFGYFHGVCSGADHLPLEQSRAVADQVAAELREHAASQRAAVARVDAGTLLPASAKNGKRESIPHPRIAGMQTSRDVLVPFAEAPECYQREAVQALRYSLESSARSAEQYAAGIVERANAITGKREITPRASDSDRKSIGPGTVVRLYGASGYDVTVARIETRTAWGVGPYLNGNAMPHIVYERNGKEYAYPVRLIRQSAIVG
jgi:hypothetical protein